MPWEREVNPLPAAGRADGETAARAIRVLLADNHELVR